MRHNPIDYNVKTLRRICISDVSNHFTKGRIYDIEIIKHWNEYHVISDNYKHMTLSRELLLRFFKEIIIEI